MMTDLSDKETSESAKAPDSGTIPEGYTYRDQSKRYPWWVRSVDKMTTETDDSIAQRPQSHMVVTNWIMQMEEFQKRVAQAMARLAEDIKNNVPGKQIQDVALLYASGTYFAGGVTMDGIPYNGIEQIADIVSVQLWPPERLGVPRWEGTEEGASEMVEAAAIHLGVGQVGYSAINPLWLPPNIGFDPDVEEVTMKGGQTLIPERFKYVISMLGLVPQAAAQRAPSAIGGAADRCGFEAMTMIKERVKNFIKGLGYDAMNLPGFVGGDIPFAVMSGLGEMGRMNRLVSPLYGGAVRIGSVLTDLPLALDKPIDFGLQEFCKHCKKCAEACPAKALSFDDEPSWEPKGPYSVPGKKVWFEDAEKCFSLGTAVYCGACMASCCWTKEDRTVLHGLVKAIGSQVPSASSVLVYLDDVFGYGLKPEGEREDWWKMKLPVKGIGSYHSRR